MSSDVIRAIACLAFALLAACQIDAPTAQPCVDIPAGGCPIAGSQVCADPTCEAVYACTSDRTWVLDHVCPPHDAGVVEAAPTEAAAPSSPRDASADVPGASGGPGCSVLQAPDCPLATALACSVGACCGCEDLFVCEDRSWNAWGTCENGNVKSR